jgi:hypothetical protein
VLGTPAALAAAATGSREMRKEPLSV